jgi:amino acid adenylation domain-containing protein
MTKEKQRDLHSRCHHPSGGWRPVDWQAPEQSVPDCIAAIASQEPNRPALYDYHRSLTYSELDQAANQIANAILAQRGPGQEVVALLVGVDALAATAALGVLKAGKIYVGLEPSFPQDRILQILDDAQAHLILADAQRGTLARQVAGSDRRFILLESLTTGDSHAPDVPVPLDSLAILNYTSGSTGKPKGVMQSHRSAYMQAVRYASYYHVCAADRLAFFGSLAWAGPFWDIFGPLCLGASAGAFDFRQHGMQPLVAWLLETEPTLVAGLMVVRQVAYANPEARFASVRLVHLGGDTIYREDVEACMRVFPNALIAVGLGCSEAGRVTEFLLDSPEILDKDILPLGFPMPGLRVKLLSDDGQEVAAGEVGELAVIGPGLATGYWRRPELTASRFRKAGSLGPEPAYLTGDLACQLPDGLLLYQGRKDNMVKIRGYQVFTNEIEVLLRDVEGVQDVCVTGHSLAEGAQRLVAYLVVNEQVFPGVPVLHDRLKGLPAHMVPQSFVLLDGLPITPTGKIDRRSLSLPERSRLSVTAEYRVARDQVEEVLTQIWGVVLGIDGIGINDDFLELGGDSLDSTRIINLTNSSFGIQIPFSEFFAARTIAAMASIIHNNSLAGTGGSPAAAVQR